MLVACRMLEQKRFGLIVNPVCGNLTSHSGFSQTVSESFEKAIPTACTVSIINDRRSCVVFLVQTLNPYRSQRARLSLRRRYCWLAWDRWLGSLAVSLPCAGARGLVD